MKFRHWSLIKLRDFYWKQPGWSKNKHTRVAYPEDLALLLLWHPYNESAYHHYEIPNVHYTVVTVAGKWAPGEMTAGVLAYTLWSKVMNHKPDNLQ